MNLPDLFLTEMRRLLGSEYESFLKSYDDKPLSGLRVNRAKISAEEFERIAPYRIEKIPFIDNGYYIDDTDGWSKHPYYFAGMYYLQEPSAMLPANRLRVEKSDAVLDLCSAPGGKATELISREPAILIANDISYSRTIPLVKNLELFGKGNVYVFSEDPVKLSSYFGQFFDKILVDAPCSGEGMFRKHPDLIKAWIERGPADYVDIQKGILEEAYKMLKPGGMLLYSTCTFSPLEDEEVIASFVEAHSDLELIDIDGCEGFSYGYDSYTSVNSKLKKCVHIFPHRVRGEGHFLTLISKTYEGTDEYGSYKNDFSNVKMNLKGSSVIGYDKLPKAVKSFMELCSPDKKDELTKSYYSMLDNGFINLLPQNYEGIAVLRRRFVRSGLVIGSLKNKEIFTPHTAFALSLGMSDFTNICNFKAGDVEVIKYLKGETIFPDTEAVIKKGYVLICVDGFPLGFGKYDGSKIKNLYDKGFRMV